ncbi:hypothetical protein GCM10009868_14200 [Terrabacter aerolatus]|uniref:Uncharacterized protein n=1 Tax=Terrabacter aerolatus TaxID=422442 RepID=A0A512D3I2_9MICO|nr:hypothetical protein [Terrabacter aerolatus]GEO31013.1 hypothetical protein TAE01_28230 [Terrabacter aerolatus]
MQARADLLSRAVREHPVVIEARDGHRCDGGTHSHLADGRVVCWVLPAAGLRDADDVCVDDLPAARAVDAELSRQAVPPTVAARWQAGGEALDAQRFWDRWCATEVLAKLADVPMVVLVGGPPVTSSPVRRHGVEVHWLVRRVADVVVAQGLSWATTTDVT